MLGVPCAVRSGGAKTAKTSLLPSPRYVIQRSGLVAHQKHVFGGVDLGVPGLVCLRDLLPAYFRLPIFAVPEN
jgi:hypothetical protein